MKNGKTSLRVRIKEIEQKSTIVFSDAFEENKNMSVNQNREMNSLKMHLNKVLAKKNLSLSEDIINRQTQSVRDNVLFSVFMSLLQWKTRL